MKEIVIIEREIDADEKAIYTVKSENDTGEWERRKNSEFAHINETE